MPYAVILIQAAQKWRSEHGGNLPKTFAEKGEFKEMIKVMDKYHGINFEEAIGVTYDLWQPDVP